MEKALRKYLPIFVLPTLVAFIIAFIIPFILGIGLSFTKFRAITDAKWVGLSNYNKVLSDEGFIHAFLFTLGFSIVAIVTINVFAFILALLLTRGLKGTDLFRTTFFMPNLIGGIVLGYIWGLIIDGVLARYGVTITYDAKYGFWGLVILMNWQLIGYMMVIYIAGIQDIPDSLLEAAKIDGASYFQILRKIIIPLVMPSITICSFLTLSQSFKLFDQNLALTAGAPANESAMLALDIFNTFYARMGFEGVGQAKAVIFFILVVLISLPQLIMTRRKEVEN